MVKNYLVIAFRGILKQKGHFLINTVGLAVGISVCLMLFLWVRDELSYDRYHENSERIYRVISQYSEEGQLKQSASTPAPLGPALVSEFPEVEKTVRFGENGFLLSYKNKFFLERIFFADPEIFDLFTFPLVQGNRETALKFPHSIVISEKIRDKYFENDNPIGKILNLNGKHDFKITGVFKNIPHYRWMENWEKETIIGYFIEHPNEDYFRLTHMRTIPYYTQSNGKIVVLSYYTPRHLFPKFFKNMQDVFFLLQFFQLTEYSSFKEDYISGSHISSVFSINVYKYRFFLKKDIKIKGGHNVKKIEFSNTHQKNG